MLLNYSAKTFNGEPKTGTIEAESEQDAARILRNEGLILISAESNKKKKTINFSFNIFGGVPLAEKLIFTRNLQVMIGAGVSLPSALRILEKQAINKNFKKIISSICDGVVKGENFSDILTKYPKVFSELYCSMVKVGEESGSMENVLKILTNQMEKEKELKSKILGAMAYPAVILCAMTLIGILMLILVVPNLAKTFKEMGVDLPITTQFVIALGNFLANFWYTLPLIFFGLYILFKMAASTKLGKKAIDTFVLRIPVISSIVRKTNSASTVRTLGSLIASGVPIVRALELVAGTLKNSYYKNAIFTAAEKVRKGARLGESLKEYEDKIYSSLVIQMIEIGEETGKTAEMLGKLADYFEDEVANATKNLSTIIEPILMIVIGALVGFFVVSMLQPMYGMIQALQTQ